MTAKKRLTIAVERYDRHFPFFDQTVTPPQGIEFNVLQVGQSVTLRDGTRRHSRMLDDKEFDICEFSMSSFLMAKQRGMDITACRSFRGGCSALSQMFVHPDSGIEHPRDLIGKKVALSSFQTTLSLLAKGDLKFEYGVPWEEIKWLRDDLGKGAVREKARRVHRAARQEGRPRRAAGAWRARRAVLPASAALGALRKAEGAAAVPRHPRGRAALLQENTDTSRSCTS